MTSSTITIYKYLLVDLPQKCHNMYEHCHYILVSCYKHSKNIGVNAQTIHIIKNTHIAFKLKSSSTPP